jgi:TonB-dependent starch-binding outer membrane protein SusC
MKIQLLILSILLVACVSGAHKSSTSDVAPLTNPNIISPDNPALSLADYLKRVPGVQVIEGGGRTQVTVRGNNTLGGEVEPLFVINGVNVGFGYENAEPLVAMTDIKSVQVLKSGQETAAYGMQGTNGVILIKTKK